MDDPKIEGGVTLCDALDRILSKGVVAHGDITISVADVDLLRISLRALVAAVDALSENSGAANSSGAASEVTP